MAKPMFDPDALIDMFSNATAKQGEQIKQAVSQATLTALQGRELTLKNIKGALKAISDAASAGAARNAMPGIDAEALLDKAVAGMDDALLKAVEANRVALTTLAAQGADLREKHIKKALDDLATKKLSDEAVALIGELRASNAELKKTLANPAWQKMPEDAAAALSRVRALVDDPTLPRTLQNLSRTLGRVDRILGGGEADLAATIDNLRQITDNLRDLTEDTKRYPAHVLFGEPPRPLEGRR